jgi:PAS domain S-box-containing protein
MAAHDRVFIRLLPSSTIERQVSNMRSGGGRTTDSAVAKSPRAKPTLRRQLDELTAELRARTIERDEALAQQNANAEILQAINASQGELAPVFEAMLNNALRLCDASFGSLVTFDGERFHLAAERGHRAFTEWIRGQKVFQPEAGTTMARMVNGETVIHIADAANEVGYYKGGRIRRALTDIGGFRTLLGVALRKDERLLGAIHIYRGEIRPFSDRQIALLRNFADQIVVALENARLHSGLVQENRIRRETEEALRVSEERWRKFFEASSAGIALAGMDGVFTAANPAFQRMLGLSEAEILGRTAVEITHPDERAATVNVIEEFKSGRRDKYRVEKRYLRRDGTPVWLDITTTRVPAGEKTGPFLQAIYVDISERKRAEEALRTSEERWRRLFEVAQVGIDLADPDGVFIAANPAFQGMLDLSEDEIKGRAAVDLTHPDERLRTATLIAELRAGLRDKYRYEKRYLRRDGSPIWLDTTVTLVPAGDQTEPFVVAVSVDMSERRRAEDALRASEERWRRLFEVSSVGIALTDDHGVFTAANLAFQKILDLTEDEIKGHMSLEWTHPDDRSEAAKVISEFVAGLRDRYRTEKRYLRRDGSLIWVDVTGTRVPAGEMTESFTVGVILDISERKRAEDALRASEERWRRLFETSAAGMGLATIEGRYLATNRAFQTMLGYTDDELKGLSPIDLSFPEERETAARAIANLASGKVQSYQVDRRYRKKDGTPMWLSITVSRVPGSEFTSPLLQAIYIDIDDRKRAETALRDSEERWRTVFEMAPVGIATFSMDRRFATANPALQRMLGYSENELRRVTGVEITVQDDRAISESMNEAIASGRRREYQLEKRYRRKDGEIVWVNANAALVSARDGAPTFYAAMFLDITARRRAEEALQHAQAELARVARLSTVGELGASIAHEINQPLAAIIASGDAALRWIGRQDLASARESVGRMIGDANRASEIVARIRALTKNRPLEQVRLDINEIVEEVLGFARIEMAARNVSVHRHLQANAPAVMGDRVQLQQVLLNLVMNALEAMNNVTSRRRELTVMSSLTEDRTLVATVRDTGPGLDPAKVGKVFDAFFTTKPNGMGLGLAISTSIVEAHGGRLWAAAAEPYGAAFSFSLPVAVEGQR